MNVFNKNKNKGKNICEIFWWPLFSIEVNINILFFAQIKLSEVIVAKPTIRV